MKRAIQLAGTECMIESITVYKDKLWQTVNFVQHHNHKVELVDIVLNDLPTTIKITFKSSIILFRNSDYSWQGITRRMLSNWYAPKILMLDNKQLIQANQHQGIWEVDPMNPKILLWHFNITNSKPLVQYDLGNSKQIAQSVSQNTIVTALALLFSHQNAIEVSRSKLPFTAIACFTDHCDFDTLPNLKQQRLFFKRHQIKITKGFFLNHYSKRPSTVSYEMNGSELDSWLEDGHELAYHSLSQSLKPIDESLNDFKNFIPPFKEVYTWIDHGFQPYNVSLYHNHASIKKEYGAIFKEKEVRIIWNYIDSGTATKGVINQLNPFQFSLQAYSKGIKHLRLKNKVPMLIKNIFFHYYGTPISLRSYGTLAKFYKTRHKKKSLSAYLKLTKSIFKMFGLLIPVLLFWKTKKNKTYPLAEYTPVLFKHDISGETFTVFQTLEMIDFKTGLHQQNIDLLIKESGLFIAHTYFSAPMNYHQGKLFNQGTLINQEVESNFAYLSQKIASKDIWNPTLKELVAYLEKFNALTFNCTENGVIFIENNDHQLASRDIK